MIAHNKHIKVQVSNQTAALAPATWFKTPEIHFLPTLYWLTSSVTSGSAFRRVPVSRLAYILMEWSGLSALPFFQFQIISPVEIPEYKAEKAFVSLKRVCWLSERNVLNVCEASFKPLKTQICNTENITRTLLEWSNYFGHPNLIFKCFNPVF